MELNIDDIDAICGQANNERSKKKTGPKHSTFSN